MGLKMKAFAGYRYQIIEDEFNQWASEVDPFIVKSILDTTPVPRQEGGHSLYFTLIVFFNSNQYGESPEVIKRTTGGG